LAAVTRKPQRNHEKENGKSSEEWIFADEPSYFSAESIVANDRVELYEEVQIYRKNIMFTPQKYLPRHLHFENRFPQMLRL
jgi:hypothetical protein